MTPQPPPMIWAWAESFSKTVPSPPLGPTWHTWPSRVGSVWLWFGSEYGSAVVVVAFWSATVVVLEPSAAVVDVPGAVVLVSSVVVPVLSARSECTGRDGPGFVESAALVPAPQQLSLFA